MVGICSECDDMNSFVIHFFTGSHHGHGHGHTLTQEVIELNDNTAQKNDLVVCFILRLPVNFQFM